MKSFAVIRSQSQTAMYTRSVFRRASDSTELCGISQVNVVFHAGLSVFFTILDLRFVL